MQATYFDFASTKISFFSSLGQMAFASFFSLFLPTCLTSLTSHIHLCDLTFVHPFINVVGLLYIIIEEKMNPILLFQTSYSSKPISLCWLLSTCPTSSFNELRQSMGWNMVQRTQQFCQNDPSNLIHIHLTQPPSNRLNSCDGQNMIHDEMHMVQMNCTIPTEKILLH